MSEFDEYDILDEYDEYDLTFEDITVNLRLSANAYDNIAILLNLIRGYFEDIGITFEVENFDFYNFENIPLDFYIVSGLGLEDIPITFCIIRQPQNFATYVMQKLSIVLTIIEEGTLEDILNWNVHPNQTWYVSLNNTVVTLYNSQSDMMLGINPVASGIADLNNQVILYRPVDEYDEYAIPESLNFYYQDVPYHLTLSGLVYSGKYKIKPLTDLDEIRHAIYNNLNIVKARGKAELNLHTNVIIKKDITLANHIPTMEPGDVVNINSTRRNKTNEKSQILSQTISGEVGNNGETSLINEITIVNYMTLYR